MLQTAPRRKVLIFHVGDHKTGSTSIQHAFAAGRVRLNGSRVLYPAALNHNYLSDQMQAAVNGKTKFADRKGMPGLDRLETLVREAEEDFILISGEAFEGFDPEAFHAQVMQRFGDAADEIRVVAYIRPHASRFLSTFAEQSKIGWHRGDLDAFFDRTAEKQRFLFAPRLEKWRSLFGPQFRVRPMIRTSLHNQSVLEDFMRAAFEDVPFEVDPAPPSNESLSLRDLVMLRYVQRHLSKVGKGTRLGFGWELARIIGQHAPDTTSEKLMLHRDLAERIRTAYADDARQIDQTFFDDAGLFAAELDLAVETARPEPQSLAPEDHFTPDALRSMAILAEALTGMLKSDSANWTAYFRRQRMRAARPGAAPDRT